MADVMVGFLHAFPPEGRGVSIVTTSGGSAVIHTDLCVKVGLLVPGFSEETQRELRGIIPLAGSSIRNPLDAWFAFRSGVLPGALDIVSRDERVHSLIIEVPPEEFKAYTAAEPGVVDEFTRVLGETCKRIMVERGKPTMIAVPPSIYHELEARIRNAFLSVGLPVYQSIFDAAKTLSRLHQYSFIKELKGEEEGGTGSFE